MQRTKVERFILEDLAAHGAPDALGGKDRAYVRDLALRVKEIGSRPEEASKIELWKLHNCLKTRRPIVIVFPEGAWDELLPQKTMRLEDPFWREWEWHLRSLIYRSEHLPDDFVFEPSLRVPVSYSIGDYGIAEVSIESTEVFGACRYVPQIIVEKDADRLTAPTLTIFEEKTRRNLQKVGDALGDILPVTVNRNIFTMVADFGIIGSFMRLRGMDQVLIDLFDRPGWVHRALDTMTEGALRVYESAEAAGLTLNNGNDYVGSGGLGWTNELPAPGHDESRVRLRDLWGFSEAQEFAGVSPAMLEEFVLPYQARLLERFGLNCYGCCESLNGSFSAVKKIPRLRRISVSPWTDPAQAAEALEDKYIFSYKPNPAALAAPRLDKDYLKAGLRKVLEIARGCVVEIIMKDTHTVRGEPQRYSQWIAIAREAVEEMTA